MLCERAAREKLDFFARGSDLASILIASARSRVFPGARSGVPERSQGLLGRSRGTPGTPQDTPKTLPRRLRDALGRQGMSREGPGSDFESILMPRGVSGDRFLIDSRDAFRLISRASWSASGITLDG